MASYVTNHFKALIHSMHVTWESLKTYLRRLFWTGGFINIMVNLKHQIKNYIKMVFRWLQFRITNIQHWVHAI